MIPVTAAQFPIRMPPSLRNTVSSPGPLRDPVRVGLRDRAVFKVPVQAAVGPPRDRLLFRGLVRAARDRAPSRDPVQAEAKCLQRRASAAAEISRDSTNPRTLVDRLIPSCVEESAPRRLLPSLVRGADVRQLSTSPETLSTSPAAGTWNALSVRAGISAGVAEVVLVAASAVASGIVARNLIFGNRTGHRSMRPFPAERAEGGNHDAVNRLEQEQEVL